MKMASISRKLRLLADWFDYKDKQGPPRPAEVQIELRELADVFDVSKANGHAAVLMKHWDDETPPDDVFGPAIMAAVAALHEVGNDAMPQQLLDVHAICDQRDAAIKRADVAELRAAQLEMHNTFCFHPTPLGVHFEITIPIDDAIFAIGKMAIDLGEHVADIDRAILDELMTVEYVDQVCFDHCNWVKAGIPPVQTYNELHQRVSRIKNEVLDILRKHQRNVRRRLRRKEKKTNDEKIPNGG